MKHSLLLLPLFALSITGCKSEITEKTEVTETAIEETSAHYSQTYTTETYAINIVAENGEMTNLSIQSSGLENEFDENYEIEGRVTNSYMTDINNDGYMEFLIEYEQTDDSGNKKLMGFASNSDKSLSPIYIKETQELKEMNSDQIMVELRTVMRKFVSEGKELIYTYELKGGESGYIMEPVKQ